MSFRAGDVLGHYRIVDKIGEGGMGQVWRATDTALGRDVAIKVLPDAVASDSERLARFEREAKLLASLNHPNIATVHGLHQQDGVRFLAMELVPGEELAERLKRGPIPLDEAREIARQTAEALEAAHEQGVVHRDLKPANIKLTPDGRVKVLDFGLAKAADPAVSGATRTSDLSPTITSLGTVAGVILGTAAYMSPEQARGKPVDKRADIWAFGCVLFEMISGRRAFDGETVSDTLASVLARDPDWSALPAATPRRLRDLIVRCLEKDPKRRLRDIGEARIELADELAGRAPEPSVSYVAPPAAARGSRMMIAALAAIAMLAIGLAMWGFMPPAIDPFPMRLMRLRVERPTDEAATGPGTFAISPDGAAVVFTLQGSPGSSHLWLRELSATAGRELPDTDGADFPFWSPDSKHVGFFANGKLKRTPRGGGAVQTLCEAPNGRGGTWSASGVIVFAPTAFGALSKVSSDGGAPEPATKLDASKKQTSHRFPSFLPGGRLFFYVTQPETQPGLSQVEIASLDESGSRPLVFSRSAPRYAPPGYLVFPRDRALVAQRIDLAKGAMTGEIVPLSDSADVLERIAGAPTISTAMDGSITYDQPDFRATDALWFTRDGRPTGKAFRHPTRVASVDTARRGERLLVIDAGPNGPEVSLASVATGVETRIVRGDRLSSYGVLTPAEDRIVLNVFNSGNGELISIDTSGGDERRILAQNRLWLLPTDVGSDGTIVFDDPFGAQQTRQSDIDYLPKGVGGEAKTYLSTASNEQGGRLSPDGRVLAYESDASGRYEVMMDTFPERTDAMRVSTAGVSTEPIRWRSDGREIFYLAADGRTLMACDVKMSPSLTVGKPYELFTFPLETIAFVPSSNADKFLVFVPVGRQQTALTLVQNWSAQLEKSK